MRFDELEKERHRNRCLSEDKFGDIISVIRRCFDAQHEYAALFYGLLGQRHFSQHSNAETPIISAVFKNEIALYSSFVQTLDGLYGSGLVQLCSVLEALMIAKFSSLRQSDQLISKWVAGETIYFSQAILKKIVTPDLKEIKILWSFLCQASHATIYSYQIAAKFEEIEEEISANLAIIRI